MSFTEYKFKPFINEALKQLQFVEPTEVQKSVINRALKNENIIVESATGTGKTHAFLLPIFQKLDENKKEVQAVIISPTRELATQLFEVSLKISKLNPNIDVRLAIGGTNREQEIKRLNNNQPQIVIGTIGRIHDLVVQTNVLKIFTASTLVIDEADMVFDERELEMIDQILTVVQNKPQFLIFSATIPKQLRHFINKYLSGVDEIIIKEKSLTKNTIEHIMIPCKAKQKTEVLKELISIINPYLALIFANTKETVDELATYLAESKVKVLKLHGDLDARTRKQTLKRIHDGEYQYVVVSDIASRGIDIEGVSHVINYELPKDIEFYIHRTGRTARYDSKGIAYSLYDYDDEKYIDLLKAKGLDAKIMKISNGSLVPTRIERTKKLSGFKLREEELHKLTKVPKKVKPGYKKKRLAEINEQLRKEKRAHIEEIYRKRNKK